MRNTAIRVATIATAISVLAVGWNAGAAPKALQKLSAIKVSPAEARSLLAATAVQDRIPSPKALKPDIHPTLSPPMQAQSAFGCLSNGSICIYVHGEGLHVDYVEGFLWPFEGSPKAWCGKAQLFFNGNLVGQSNEVCLKPGDSAFAVAWVDADFPDPSLVCVGFTGWSGRPCETVHS